MELRHTFSVLAVLVTYLTSLTEVTSASYSWYEEPGIMGRSYTRPPKKMMMTMSYPKPPKKMMMAMTYPKPVRNMMMAMMHPNPKPPKMTMTRSYGSSGSGSGGGCRKLGQYLRDESNPCKFKICDYSSHGHGLTAKTMPCAPGTSVPEDYGSSYKASGNPCSKIDHKRCPAPKQKKRRKKRKYHPVMPMMKQKKKPSSGSWSTKLMMVYTPANTKMPTYGQEASEEEQMFTYPEEDEPKMNMYEEPEMEMYKEPEMESYEEPEMQSYEQPMMNSYEQPKMESYEPPRKMNSYMEPEMQSHKPPRMMMMESHKPRRMMMQSYKPRSMMMTMNSHKPHRMMMSSHRPMQMNMKKRSPYSEMQDGFDSFEESYNRISEQIDNMDFGYPMARSAYGDRRVRPKVLGGRGNGRKKVYVFVPVKVPASSRGTMHMPTRLRPHRRY